MHECKTCPILCSKSPVPVGGADEPSEDLQRSKVQYEAFVMIQTHGTSVLRKTVCVCLVCSFLFIRIQQQETSRPSGGAQTHAVPPTGRRTQDQPITRVQWSPNRCTLGEGNTGAGTVNESDKHLMLFICCDFNTFVGHRSWGLSVNVQASIVQSETKITLLKGKLC